MIRLFLLVLYSILNAPQSFLAAPGRSAVEISFPRGCTRHHTLAAGDRTTLAVRQHRIPMAGILQTGVSAPSKEQQSVEPSTEQGGVLAPSTGMHRSDMSGGGGKERFPAGGGRESVNGGRVLRQGSSFDNLPVQTVSGDGSYNAVLIVPTGIGAAIGGYAGDALPVAR